MWKATKPVLDIRNCQLSKLENPWRQLLLVSKVKNPTVDTEDIQDLFQSLLPWGMETLLLKVPLVSRVIPHLNIPQGIEGGHFQTLGLGLVVSSHRESISVNIIN